WTLLLSYKKRVTGLLIVNVIVSLLLLGDLLYFRFFKSVLNIPVMMQAGQVEGVADSVFSLFRPGDVLLILDFILLVPYLRWRKRRRNTQQLPKLPIKVKVAGFLTVFLVALVTLGLMTQQMVNAAGQKAVTNMYTNTRLLNSVGILNYHVLDFVSTVKGHQYAKEVWTDQTNQEAQEIRSWMDVHRQATPNKYQGIAKGKNVIIIQLEAMQNFLVNRQVNGQEVTPNMNKLIGESLYFDNYFPQIGQGNTSDAEFMSLNSLYPTPAGSVYVLAGDKKYQSLPWALKEDAGYQSTYAFHTYEPVFWNRANAYISEGFDRFFSKDDFPQQDIIGMAASDAELYDKMLQELKQAPQPNMSLAVTLSGHHPYKIPDDKKGLNIPEGAYSEIFTNYLQCQHYADEQLGLFIDKLKREGLLDDTLLVFYGDHFGSGFTDEDLAKFNGLTLPLSKLQQKELFTVPLFIRLPQGQPAGVQHISGGQMDLYPTLINLLGLDKQKLFYMGQDLLNAQDGYSVFRFYFGEGSFATDELFYLASGDGEFANGTCYSRASGEPVETTACTAGYNEAKKVLEMSDLIRNTDGLPYLTEMKH
ncbi:MAG TPA: LTA synthase family protein, partial [Bacilli bacterium]|nr:LTA synthase family protein [Bacilli bacterium]